MVVAAAEVAGVGTPSFAHPSCRARTAADAAAARTAAATTSTGMTAKRALATSAMLTPGGSRVVGSTAARLARATPPALPTK